MSATRWGQKLRQFAGTLHREFRIATTRPVTPDKWVFIVGCYNSGTELLMHLLDAHPEISALPDEGQFLTDQLVCDYEIGLPRMWTLREDVFRLSESDRGPDPNRLKREWMIRLDQSCSVFLEKSPPNMGRARWLQEHFHNAHFIALVRNGYAVAEGIRRKAEPHHLPGNWPIGLCARQWRRCHEILLQDAAHLERLEWLSYEDLTENTEDAIGRVLEFLGFDREDTATMNIHGTWEVHERDEPIRNLNDESIERLSEEEIREATAEMDAMLARFGYEARTSSHLIDG